MRFSGNVDNDTKSRRRDFGGDLDYHQDIGIKKNFFFSIQ